MITRQSPDSSALMRALDPDAAEWGLPEHLLAAAFDALQIANWQRAGGKRHERPKQIERPGVTKSKQLGSGAIPMDEMKRRLGWTT